MCCTIANACRRPAKEYSLSVSPWTLLLELMATWEGWSPEVWKRPLSGSNSSQKIMSIQSLRVSSDIRLEGTTATTYWNGRRASSRNLIPNSPVKLWLDAFISASTLSSNMASRLIQISSSSPSSCRRRCEARYDSLRRRGASGDPRSGLTLGSIQVVTPALWSR
ncbi:hypothetical protein FA13DRAFT_863981 [Coprinellus micaceus]|uniref:Uncharacterized protein n=1 Tax=Coprinellus micaceus TaxID=71717 RepID=A0A4Y7S1C4_COPMI|nr:hypothetical protein FA13DRAFT_863981 [Coprinellus micaceus]